MKIKMMTAIAAAAFAMTASATAGATNPGDECRLNSGCFFVSGGDSSPGYWVCPDPSIYALCTDT